MATPTPNARLAYLVLDHIDAHPEQWNQMTYFTQDDCGTQACFAGWSLLLSGIQMDENTDVIADDLPPELADRVLELLEKTRLEVDERWPMVHVEAPDVAQVLLGLDSLQASNLFYGLNRRPTLGIKVADIFGPRPKSDGGPLTMTPAEIAAELAVDRLALPQPSMVELDVATDIVNTPGGNR